MKKALLLVLLTTTLLLAGCETIEINKASIPLGFGTDYKDKRIIFTSQLANPRSPEAGAGQGPQFVVVSADGDTVAEAARKITLSNSQTPLWGHASLLLFSENFARNDMALFMDFVARNRFVRKNIPVVITHNATPEEVFNVKPLVSSYTATVIRDLLQTQESQIGIYTSLTLLELIDKFTVPGVEPVVPMITIDNSGQPEKLKLEGMAVFKGRKMVGSLNENESRGYRFMRPKMIQGGLFIIPSPLDEKSKVTLELSRSQAKITPVIQGSDLKMKIEIKAEGNFYEQGGSGNLFTMDMIKKLEQSGSREIEKQISLCINKAQSLDSDILGWGRIVHSSNPKIWNEMASEWEQIFPNVEPEITVKYEIRRSYLTDTSFVFRE
ncbi:MAG: Ger(x)C family spore germination protein [Syntrophomonadaceae bacterium]|nr:Ger(x)C family spore germination protein [Syntrophomonadaceae bacterium]